MAETTAAILMAAGASSSTAATAASVAGSVASAAPYVAAGGSLLSGIQGFQAGKAQAKLARQQAELERRNADYAARSEADRSRRYRAAQLAAYGKSGVTMSGTPGDVLAQTAIQQEKDILAIRYGGELRKRRALGVEKASKQEGFNSLIGGFSNAAIALSRKY